MRVLHVSEAAASGTLHVVGLLSERLVAAGHAVAVAYGRRPETPADDELLFDGAVERMPLAWDRRTPPAQLRAGLALRRLVQNWRPDLVHLHSAFAGAVGAAALGGRVPLVYSPHGSPLGRSGDGDLRRAVYAAGERLVARRVDVVGAVSAAEAMVVRGVASPGRVVVVPNGLPELDPGCLPQVPERSQPRAVAVGRIVPQRRPAETAGILAALAEVAEVRWVGCSPNGEDSLVHAAGVPVTGWLAHEAALAEVAKATVLVHWSAWEGASLVVLEAMARDVCVVASAIPANRELVGDRQAVPRAGDAVALARAALSDEGLREELLRDQRARRNRYGADRMAARWLELYRSVLARKERQATESRAARATRLR